jgi:uncharacterized protein (DUF433 family)
MINAPTLPRTDTRVVSNPRILGGMPVIEGTRVPVENVLAEFRERQSKFDVFRAYPSLPPDSVEVCLQWDRAGRPI